jgi:hypothetical protein
MVMKSVVTPLFGSTKLPTKVAPGSSRMTSPALALLSAPCKSPPAATAIVVAFASDPVASRHTNVDTAPKYGVRIRIFRSLSCREFVGERVGSVRRAGGLRATKMPRTSS